MTDEDTAFKPPPPYRKPRGFAALSPERRKEMASLGGKAAQDKGVAHRWNADEARANGRKGGMACAEKHPDHMVTIGNIGGSVIRRRSKDRECSPSVDTSQGETSST